VKKEEKMNSNKLVLVTIAVVAIGIFALPSTISMFGGQHNWYDLGPAGNQVPCIKCHGDVYDEFTAGGVHHMLGGGNASNATLVPNPDDACMYCHRTNPNIQYAEGDTASATPGQEAHAASTVACMLCHEYNPSVDISGSTVGSMAGYFAGGFWNMSANVTTPYNYTYPGANTNGSKAAHNAYIEGAIIDPLMDDSNEACIACHTHVAIDINWTKEYKMALDVVGDHDGNWTCENFASEGNYSVSTYGNMSGGTAWSNVTNITWPNGDPVGTETW
jgi:hypothetical protein